MISAIPDVIPPPKPGPLEPIDEVIKDKIKLINIKLNNLSHINQIPSPTDYYNGDLKLNVLKVKCKTYANETDCLHQSNCGIILNIFNL